MNKTLAATCLFICGCIYYPIPKEYPHNNPIGNLVRAEELSEPAIHYGKPPPQFERLNKAYQQIEEVINTTPQGRKRYKALEKIGMYCMHFDISKKVECRYKAYTNSTTGSTVSLDARLLPLLKISLIPDEGIETFYYTVEVVNIDTKFGVRLNSENFGELRNNILNNVMREDMKTGVKYE